MSLPSLLSFLSVFLIVTGLTMWLVDRYMDQFGCLADWGTGTFMIGAACLGLWIHGNPAKGLQVMALTSMLFVAGGFLMRGLIRFADGRDHAVLNMAARLQYAVTGLLIFVHLLLGMPYGQPNVAFISAGLAGFGVIGTVSLLRTVELAEDNEWLKPPLRTASAAIIVLTGLALLIAVVRAAGARIEMALNAGLYSVVAVLSVVLVYSMMWIVFVLYRKRTEDLAGTDELTGVLNRNGINHEIRRHFSSGRSSQIVVLQIDVDHFKRINDEHGHQTGDRVLREIARTLRTSCRTTDLVARTGGEEFLIACVGADPNTALELAERVRISISRTEIHRAQGDPVTVSVSIGLSAPFGGYAHWREAWRQADNALFRAKSLGCNICISHRSAR